MEDTQVLFNKILSLTSSIETNYPELYRFLDENPITIPSFAHPTLDKDTLNSYLEDLTQLLNHHLLTQKIIKDEKL